MIGDDVKPATYREVFAVGAFRVLFGSYVLLLIGDTVRMLALAVLVYERTGSPALSALAYVAGFVPQAFGGALLLSLTDRVPVRAAMAGYDLIRCALALVLALDVLPVWTVLLLLASVGLVSPIAGAARQRTLPELLHGDAYVLGRSVFGMTAGAMQVLGFAVGGLLLALAGSSGALLFAAATALASAVVVRLGLAPGPRTERTGSTRAEGTVRATLRVNRELLGDRTVRGLLLAQWIPANLAVAAEGVVVPYSPVTPESCTARPPPGCCSATWWWGASYARPTANAWRCGSPCNSASRCCSSPRARRCGSAPACSSCPARVCPTNSACNAASWRPSRRPAPARRWVWR